MCCVVCFVCLRPVSCVTNVASFSVLSIQIILGVVGNTVFFNVYLKHCKDRWNKQMHIKIAWNTFSNWQDSFFLHIILKWWATRTSPKLEETQGKSFLHLIRHPPCCSYCQCVGHYYMQTSKNSVNKTWVLLQRTDVPSTRNDVADITTWSSNHKDIW
jgi:hypothetical protein